MRWQRGRGGRWIEDRRGRGGGLRGPIAVGGGGIGLVGLVIFLLISALGGGGGGSFQLPNLPAAPSAGPQADVSPNDDLEQFMGFVLEDNHQTWQAIFRRAGREGDYEPARMVIFEQATQSGCGFASAQTGPFYCPADRKMYLDFGFFRELASRFGAPGDFAQAYVVSHEYAHHIQNLLGVMDDVQRAQQEGGRDANELSIRLELQADCFAGVWAHSAYSDRLLEPGDLEEGLAAAAAVGDDRIQREAQGRVNPETWTHGSSEQRVRWFRRGFDSGDPSTCDTFAADDL